jgi:TolA-binding protein
MKPPELRSTPLFIAVLLTLGATVIFGCGTVQEGTNEDWTTTPPVSVTARLEYRIDSLTNENRKLQQQLETVTAENRNLIARAAELQSRLSELMAAPAPRTTTTSGSTGTTLSPSPAGYEAALAKFRKRNFRGAIDDFTALLNGGIGADLADNCHYWIGESYFGLKKFNEAIQHFEVVLGMTGSDKADDAQFMIGNCYAQLGRRNEARQAFQRLLSDYPDSPLRSRAQAKLNSL